MFRLCVGHSRYNRAVGAVGKRNIYLDIELRYHTVVKEVFGFRSGLKALIRVRCFLGTY